jgi:hypothetical protein
MTESRSGPEKQSPPATEQLPGTADAVPTPPAAAKDWHAWVATINQMVQILAIVIAGFWTWKVFHQTVAPGLEPKTPIDTAIYWAAVPGTDVCEARFEVSVKNEGQVPFDIDDVKVTGWLVDLEEKNLLPKDSLAPTHLGPEVTDENDPKSAKPFDTRNGDPIKADLSDHYPPGGHTLTSTQYFFKRRPKTVVILLANIYGTRPSGLLPFFSKKEKLKNYSYAIDQVCGGPWDNKALSLDLTNPARDTKSPH